MLYLVHHFTALDPSACLSLNLSPSLLYLAIDIFAMNGIGYQPLNGISSLLLSCLFIPRLSLFSWYHRPCIVEKINANRLLDRILEEEEEAEKAGCCRGRRAMRTHGGGRATSAPSNPNGSTTTSKVMSIFCSSYALSVYFHESQMLFWIMVRSFHKLFILDSRNAHFNIKMRNIFCD